MCGLTASTEASGIEPRADFGLWEARILMEFSIETASAWRDDLAPLRFHNEAAEQCVST